MLGVAGAWAVERSARWERAARRATWPAAAGRRRRSRRRPTPARPAARSRCGRGRGAGPCSPPRPPAACRGSPRSLVLDARDRSSRRVAAVRSCGDCPAERHLRRAEARASAVASLASFDARTARRALETRRRARRRPAGRAPRAGRARRASPIPWRDAVAALRTPGRVVEGRSWPAAATALGLLKADRPVAVLAAARSLVYLGASRLLWPLRAELDVPGRVRVLLRPRIGRVLLAHALVPALVTTAAAALAAAGCALAGALPGARRRRGAARRRRDARARALRGDVARAAAGGSAEPPVTAVAADPSGVRISKSPKGLNCNSPR